ncbi:MAG: DUF2891 domain-containing protein, partial [Crocinitomicaceae bacterium]|nr:DUF2891 domain-containing protein [Crocinitomicaceae bacterium]
MKRVFYFLIGLIFFGCSNDAINSEEIDNLRESKPIDFTQENAWKLSQMPLTCIDQEYPNKPGIVLDDSTGLQTPQALHPAFYGCFDWHSSVHGHWSIVALLKKFPKMNNAKELRALLKDHLSSENISKELKYFKVASNSSFERTYGWAWLLKLDLELMTWDDPLGKELHENLKPLARYISKKYVDFLPKLNHPIRVGTHANTAFGLRFAYEYALETSDSKLMRVIRSRAKAFYMKDENCPISWEPDGTDFLSPCLEEANLMKYILPKKEFNKWLRKFLPQLFEKDFKLAVGEVSDRTDGHLVHLDGLNFSRAWCLNHLAEDRDLKHLQRIADEHINYSYPNLVG